MSRNRYKGYQTKPTQPSKRKSPLQARGESTIGATLVVCMPGSDHQQTTGDMSRVGVDYIQDYFLSSFTYGLGMITRYPNRATSSGCPAGRMSLPAGCSPRESEGDTQTTHRRTKPELLSSSACTEGFKRFLPFREGTAYLMTQPLLGQRATLSQWPQVSAFRWLTYRSH